MAQVTIGKRSREAALKTMKHLIETEFPDPVLRLDASKSGSQQPDLNTVYTQYNLIKPPFSMAIMARLLDLDPYLSGAVDAVATNVSACKMYLEYTGDGDAPEEQEKTLHEFFFESSDPTNPMSLQEKIKACAVDYISLGNWNLEITGTGKRLIDLVHAPAEFVRVTKGMAGYMMVKDATKIDFSLYGGAQSGDTNQILRAINKMPGHRVYGKPLTYSLVNTVLMNSLRDEKNLDWFDQGVLADLMVLVEESIDEAIKQRIVTDFQNTSDGTQTMYILDGVGKGVIEQIKRELEGKSFDTMEENNRQRVLTALRVPPAKVAIYEDANRANTLTQDEVFQSEVIKPIQGTFKVRFDHLIKHGFGFNNWEFKMKPISLKDRKAEAEIDKIYLDSAVYNLNDVLIRLGMKPTPNGDRRLINTPLGLVDVDTWEIAVADPTQNPAATAERLAKNNAIGLIVRLAELRQELQKETGHTCDTIHS
ncbi:MAG: hypothetical protein AVO39_10190 [delta proteobacterium MLS_D]|nr:MAG: hypothetical protein AVO39_10190 [delta proteobacterium MLS_D]